MSPQKKFNFIQYFQFFIVYVCTKLFYYFHFGLVLSLYCKVNRLIALNAYCYIPCCCLKQEASPCGFECCY